MEPPAGHSYMSRVRFWCFTLHNYTDADEVVLKSLVSNDVCNYVLYGHETCPETGRKHLQGYLEFKERKRMSQVKTILLRNDVHLEPSKGTAEQNEKYCKKEGDYYEAGTPENTKVKKYMDDGEPDYNALIDMFKDGKVLKDVCIAFPKEAVRNFNSLKGLEELFKPGFHFKRYFGPFSPLFPHSWDRENKSLVLIGEPGNGKTQWALNQFENPYFCRNINRLRGFDPRIHDGIVFDDIENEELPRSVQINLTDVTQCCSVRVLYGCVDIPHSTPRIFTFNRNKVPLDLLDGAIKRRCKVYYLYEHLERIDE